MDLACPHSLTLNSPWWQFLCILCCFFMLTFCEQKLQKAGIFEWAFNFCVHSLYVDTFFIKQCFSSPVSYIILKKRAVCLAQRSGSQYQSPEPSIAGTA